MNTSTAVKTSISNGPLVSVIIPCHNTRKYISDAIESILSQDYPNIEVIVVDDGSSDGTPEVVARFGDDVRLITQANQGAAVARNTGLAAAQGEFIAFLDSDDLWLPGKVSAQVDYLREHPEIGLVFSRWAVWKPHANGMFPAPETLQSPPGKNSGGDIVPERSGWLYNRLLFSSLMHTITVMARKELIEKVGTFDTALKRGQDYDYWLRASRETEIHQLNRVYALYRVHGEGCITKWPDENYEYTVVNKALERWGAVGPNGEVTSSRLIERRLSDVCCSFGYHHYHEGDPSIASRSYRQALSHAPANTHALRYLIMSWVKKCFARSPTTPSLLR